MRPWMAVTYCEVEIAFDINSFHLHFYRYEYFKASFPSHRWMGKGSVIALPLNFFNALQVFSPKSHSDLLLKIIFNDASADSSIRFFINLVDIKELETS